MFRISTNFSSAFRILNDCKRCLSAGPTEITVMPNGIKVATEETNSPIACISLFVRSGPRFESARYNGIAHFIEHMAYKGFFFKDLNLLEQMFEKTAAKFTVHTSRDYQYFSAVGFTEHLRDIVSILSHIAIDLNIPEKEANIEKRKILLEAIDKENDPKAIVFDYLHQTAFQGTPLGQGIIGPLRNLDQFDCLTANTYICETYHPSRLVIASSGGVSHKHICSLIEENFFHIAPSPKTLLPIGPQRFTGSEILYRDDSMPFAHIAIAVEAPGFNSIDYMPLLVASYIIGTWDKSQGGGFGNSSLVARASSISNLSTYFKSFYLAYPDVGLWGVYYVSEADTTDDMLHCIQDRWMNICCTTTNSDVQRAANKAKLELSKNYEGVVKSSLDIGKQVLYTSQRKSLSTIYKEISEVTPEKIREIGNKYIYDKCPAVSAVGPTEVLSDYVRIRSGMYWLRF